MKLQTRTTCQLQGVDDEWDTEDLDCGDEIESAVSQCHEDRETRFVTPEDGVWLYKIQWNENTDSVWVGRYGYNGGMEAQYD